MPRAHWKPGSWKAALGATVGVWIVVALWAAAEAFTAVHSRHVALLLAAALGGTAATVWQARRRTRALRDLEAVAERLISGDLIRSGPSRPVAPAPSHAPDHGFRALGVMLDEMTARVSDRLKEAAKRSRNLEALFDALDEPVLATDNADRVLLCNRSAESIFAPPDPPPSSPRPPHPHHPLVGRSITSIFTQEALLAMHAAAKAGETRRGRLSLTTTLGPRVFQVSAAPVPPAWGQGVFGAVMVLRDVTELDRSVQVRSDFVANASHELRTPVSAIRAAVETLIDIGLDDPAMTDRLLPVVLSHALRLEEMIRDLLDLSRLESPDAGVEIGPAEPRELAHALTATFEEARRERKLELVFDLDPALAGMLTDRKLLLLILRNLIENAIKFAYESTQITVVGRRIPLTGAERPDWADLKKCGGDALPAPGAEAPTDTHALARFEVTDRGIGIPINQQERVFERYYQVDPARSGMTAHRGTGLGLSIVKHAAKALGGEVGLRSVWRQGTTVWVELPIQLEPPTNEPRA